MCQYWSVILRSDDREVIELSTAGFKLNPAVDNSITSRSSYLLQEVALDLSHPFLYRELNGNGAATSENLGASTTELEYVY